MSYRSGNIYGHCYLNSNNAIYILECKTIEKSKEVKMSLSIGEKRTIQKSINRLCRQINTADHKNFHYQKGHSELEFTIAKIVDRLLLMERDDIADYPAPRYNVWVGLTGDYPKRLDSFREDNK